jgi:4-hydroxybutyrate CoA-transferase
MLAASGHLLGGVSLYTLLSMGDAPYAYTEPCTASIKTFFPGAGLRKALNAGRVEALRYPLSKIPSLFDRNEVSADIVFLQVSEPDADGYVSLGISVDYMPAVLRQKPVVVAEINPRMPITCGESRFHASDIDWYIQADELPYASSAPKPDEIDARIANNVASLIRDGSVLQVGIGTLPQLVLGKLGHLKHLGLHCGMISDAARPLIESGIVDNSQKRHFPGVTVTSMAVASHSFYDFLNKNKAIAFLPCDVTNNGRLIAETDRFVAVNSALQVDLAGYANAERANGKMVALPGGLPDFSSAATKARKGLSIIAIRSSFGNGKFSNIVASCGAQERTLVPEDISYVVTEFGIATIKGVDPAARAHGLVSIAHPDFRDELEALLRKST